MVTENSGLKPFGTQKMSDVSSTWFFIKVIGAVTLALGVLVVALTPGLYTGVNKDTPEYWTDQAKHHVEEKDYKQAIEAYQKVLTYESDRDKIFVQADQRIKALEQLQSRREAQENGSEDKTESGDRDQTQEQ